MILELCQICVHGFYLVLLSFTWLQCTQQVRKRFLKVSMLRKLVQTLTCPPEATRWNPKHAPTKMELQQLNLVGLPENIVCTAVPI